MPAACNGDALLTDDGCKTNGYDNFSRIKFWKTPVAKCASQSTCVPYYRWVTDYMGQPWADLAGDAGTPTSRAERLGYPVTLVAPVKR